MIITKVPRTKNFDYMVARKGIYSHLLYSSHYPSRTFKENGVKGEAEIRHSLITSLKGNFMYKRMTKGEV